MPSAPAFGQADLTNCERELLHLAGSVQPHGVLLELSATELVVLQVSGNAASLLGIEPDALLQQTLAVLGGDVAGRVAEWQRNSDLREPVVLNAGSDRLSDPSIAPCTASPMAVWCWSSNLQRARLQARSCMTCHPM